MILTIELTPEVEERLSQAARQAGVKPEDFAQRLIATLPLAAEIEEGRTYKASELLKLPVMERNRYLRAAAERAAAEYETDLALSPTDRELTAFSVVAGADFLDGSTHD